MALVPFKSTEKQGKASSKSIFSLALVLLSLIAWMCLFKQKIMAIKEGKELATVKVYLNTGIIAGLVGIGFVASTLIFGVLLLVLK